MKDFKLEEITAESMRELIKKSDDSSLELERILNAILVESKADKLELYLSGYDISTSIKQELESRGFIINVGGRYNEIDTVIRW